MFCACAMNDAACTAVIFLPVCAFTSLMNAASVPHASDLSFAATYALDQRHLVGEALTGADTRHRGQQPLELRLAPLTVTVKVAVTGLFASPAAVAVQLTVVTPIGNSDPEAGRQFTAGSGESSSTTVGGV